MDWKRFSSASIPAQALDDFSMLEGVGLGDRRELIAAARRRKLAAGDVLIRQGVRDGRMYLVLKGSLRVHLDGVDSEAVATIAAGDTVGELGVLDGSAASAFVVAAEDCRLLEVAEEDFWRLTNSSHAFALNLLLKLASRLRANNVQVRESVAKRQQYERAAMFDSLTGIHNRRWLDDTLARMVKRYEGGAGNFSLSLVDVDHFKNFNDTYGHAAGDHVLSVVADVLASNLRPTDLVARFGGEEFVILLPNTTLSEATVAAERVRAAIEIQDLTMPDGTKLRSLTISMGVAELGPNQSAEELLSAADDAMYVSKKQGRNRVTIA